MGRERAGNPRQVVTTASPLALLRAARRSIDHLAATTPVSRDRGVDAVRAFAIGVVVVWHWALSVTHVQAGRLVMPNPIDEIPLGWLATWFLQVVPLFFLVGGFANRTAWDRAGRAAGPFLRRRLARLLYPAGIFLAVWAAAEGVLLVAVPGYPGVVEYGLDVFVPLWFLAAYLGVVLLVPATAAAHRRAPVATVVLLGSAVAALDLLRFGAGVHAAGLVNSGLVWLFVHQLGYLWRDGVLDRPHRRRALAAASLAGLVVLTALGVYPRSMVATPATPLSPMFPTVAGIGVLAAFQLGVLLLLRPAVEPWLYRARVWKVVVAVNAVAMTVFLWHMTALLAAFALIEVAGLAIPQAPTAAWWAERPLWLLVPGVILAVLIAVFATAETGRPRDVGAVADGGW